MAVPVSCRRRIGKHHLPRPLLRWHRCPYLVAEPHDRLRTDFAPNAVAVGIEPTLQFLLDEQRLHAVEPRNELDLARPFGQSMDAVNVTPSSLPRLSRLGTIQPFQVVDPHALVAE